MPAASLGTRLVNDVTHMATMHFSMEMIISAIASSNKAVSVISVMSTTVNITNYCTDQSKCFF